jgi:hypothetical protein
MNYQALFHFFQSIPVLILAGSGVLIAACIWMRFRMRNEAEGLTREFLAIQSAWTSVGTVGKRRQK